MVPAVFWSGSGLSLYSVMAGGAAATAGTALQAARSLQPDAGAHPRRGDVALAYVLGKLQRRAAMADRPVALGKRSGLAGQELLLQRASSISYTR